MSGPSLPYTTYRSYLKKRFGAAVHKIPVNGGFSCPNRDGVKGTEGCAFCDNRSFSPVAKSKDQVLEQLRAAISRSTYDLYLPYLQPFSNTYATLSRLKEIYEPLIREPGVIGLAVGTRPDCFPDEILDYLADFSRRTYLSIELGLQSASNQVLKGINRGHTVEDFERTVITLDNLGIETVAHVMFGLPGQTEQSIADMGGRLASLPVSGVKIHQMMIIEDTLICRCYREGAVDILPLERYADLVALFLRRLRPNQLIHRLMADCRPEHGLVAPMWSARKRESLRYIQKVLRQELDPT